MKPPLSQRESESGHLGTESRELGEEIRRSSSPEELRHKLKLALARVLVSLAEQAQTQFASQALPEEQISLTKLIANPESLEGSSRAAAAFARAVAETRKEYQSWIDAYLCRYLLGFSDEEIATYLDVPGGTSSVKDWTAKVKGLLRTEIQEKGYALGLRDVGPKFLTEAPGKRSVHAYQGKDTPMPEHGQPAETARDSLRASEARTLDLRTSNEEVRRLLDLGSQQIIFSRPGLSQDGDTIIGEESAGVARAAVEPLLRTNAKLRGFVEHRVHPWPDSETLESIIKCPSCPGNLHCVGQSKTPSGQILGSGTYICDHCGHILWRR